MKHILVCQITFLYYTRLKTIVNFVQHGAFALYFYVANRCYL
jgi:hypothetical protein